MNPALRRDCKLQMAPFWGGNTFKSHLEFSDLCQVTPDKYRWMGLLSEKQLRFSMPFLYPQGPKFFLWKNWVLDTGRLLVFHGCPMLKCWTPFILLAWEPQSRRLVPGFLLAVWWWLCCWPWWLWWGQTMMTVMAMMMIQLSKQIDMTWKLLSASFSYTFQEQWAWKWFLEIKQTSICSLAIIHFQCGYWYQITTQVNFCSHLVQPLFQQTHIIPKEKCRWVTDV